MWVLWVGTELYRQRLSTFFLGHQKSGKFHYKIENDATVDVLGEYAKM